MKLDFNLIPNIKNLDPSFREDVVSTRPASST